MKIWTKTAEFSEGKFLVVRRDGTTPDWPHFVLGARDPAAPAALRSYADKTHDLGFDPDYYASVAELADDFERYRQQAGNGDPEAPPHRADCRMVIAMMRRTFAVADVVTALERIELAGMEGRPMAAAAIARLLLDGHKAKVAK